jgi:integrase
MAWLYRYDDSKNWYIGFRVGSRLVQRSTRTRIESEAKKQLAALEAVQGAHNAGLPIDSLFSALKGSTAPSVTLHAEVESWLAESSASVEPSTVEAYRGITNIFKRFVGATPQKPLLNEISPATIRAFVDHLRQKKAPGTVNNRLKMLRVLFARATREGRMSSNPAAQIKTVRRSVGEERARRPFTVEEVGTLLRHAEPFWRYAVLAGFYTGLRLGDIATMPSGAVDLREGVIRLVAGKTRTRVTIPLASPLRKALEPLVALRKPTEDIWPQEAELYRTQGAKALSPRFHDLLVKCGLVVARNHKKSKGGRDAKRESEGISFHSLRHSFVSILKASGSTQGVARSLAGHSSDAMSDHYTSIPLETLKEAVARLPEVAL